MSLRTWIAAKLAPGMAQAATVGGWNVLPWQDKRPYIPNVKYGELVKKYQSWVYACASKNANSCAQVPLRLYGAKPSKGAKSRFQSRKLERSERNFLTSNYTTCSYVRKAADVEEVLEHPFLDLIRNVNEFMNGYDLLESMFLAQELTGNAYWHIGSNEQGVPLYIWPLRPQYMTIVPSKQHFIQEYVWSITNTENFHILPEDMIHFKYVNPQDAFFGLGPLQAAVVAADLGLAMNLFEVAMFKNNAMPDIAIVLPEEAGTPSPETHKLQELEWKKKFGGIKRAGKPAFLTGGAKIERVSMTPKEMNYLQGRSASLNEVAAIFGVPMSKLTVENVNRANAEAGDYAYMKDTINPRLRKAEQKMNEQLLPMYDTQLFCAFDNPIPLDKEFRLKEVESHLKTGYASINQERQSDGQEPVMWGEVPLMPMNVMPIGTMPVEPVAPEVVEPAKQIKAPRRMPPLEHPTNFVNEEFEAVLAKYFRDIEKEVLAGFDKDVENLKRYSPMTKAAADDFLAGWFDVVKWNKELPDRTEPFVRRTMLAGGERSLHKLLPDKALDPLNPGVMVSLEKHRNTRIRSINSTVQKKLRKTLSEGIEAGKGVAVLRSNLMNEFNSMERSTAVMIARTETIWAFNEGAVLGYVQSGLVSKKIWISSGDERTCDWCPQMDGKVVEVEVDFFGKGGTPASGIPALAGLNLDYEDVGHPPLHPMCRCAIAPVVEVL